MKVPYFDYWGKTSEDGGYHLAAFHCLDVAAVAEQWLRADSVLRSRLGGMLGLSDESAPPGVAFLCALHDFGKFDARFQMKAPTIAEALRPERRGLPPDSYDHGAWGYHQLRELDEDLGCGSAQRGLWLAITGHHGSFPSARHPVRHPAYRRVRSTDEDARRLWLQHLRALFTTHGAEPLWPERAPSMAAVELLAGFCAISDWIGSQRDFFPFESHPQPLSDYYDTALERAAVALDAVGLCGAKPTGRGFRDLFAPYEPRGIQAATEALDLPEGPCLLILEAETGSGKTEASLSLASRFLARGDATRLFFALPTIATSNAIFERIERVAGLLFQGSVNLLLAHGRSRTSEAFRRLAERSIGEREDADGAEASVACARWFLTRKRVLLGQVGVGTVDQAMQAAIRVRHHFVRAFALGTSVLVIDEVHAYDVYMEVILERLVEWMGALGAPVILLSATLPATRKASLCAAYRRGLGAEADEPQAATPARRAPYPLITRVSRDRTEALPAGVAGPSRRVALRLESSGSPGNLQPLVLEAARRGAMVGWVRNTVREAQEAHALLAAADVPATLFHARFRQADRQEIESAVLQDYGVKGKRHGAVLVATQVVEQSLDIDFDLLVTDLAPIDLLVQRIGRLHRHARVRPAGFESPRVIVSLPSPDERDSLQFGPSRYVYDPVTLWLTAQSLSGRSELVLPDEVRELVEATYDPEQRVARLKQAVNAATLLTAEGSIEANLAKRRGHAAQACIPPTGGDPASIHSFPDDDANVRALTRDGESVSLILVEWDGVEGKSLAGDSWSLANAKGVEDWKLARDLASETINVPVQSWDGYERGLPKGGESRQWTRLTSRLSAILQSIGVPAVLVPVWKDGEVWKGEIQMTRGVQLLAYSREAGLTLSRKGANA